MMNAHWTDRLCRSLDRWRQSTIGPIEEEELRARAEITSAFRIPSAPQLRPGLNREILNVGRATPPISLNRPGQICGTSGRANREVISARTLTLTLVQTI